jgi:protein-S-isoprenylcysteine O-methyltransferase Ste14
VRPKAGKEVVRVSRQQAGLKVRKHRDDDAGEHRLADAGQLTVFLVFMAVWITDSFFFKYSSFPNNYIPLAVQISFGVIFLIISGYLAMAGMKAVFGEVRESPVLVRKGVFAVIRHPIYMSEILLYLGMLFFSTSLAAVGVWVVGIAFFHYISRYEEKVLLAQFGDEYRQYMKDVPMYLPRLRRRTRD